MHPPEPRVPSGIDLLAITLVAAVARLPWLTADPLWFDEIFSVVVASQELPELLRRAAADQTNPPGFYLLLWGWIRLGTLADGWLRLLPALAGILTPGATLLLAREFGAGRRAAILAGVLAAMSPLLLAMSVEVRAYSFLALAATVAFLVAARLARSVRDGGSIAGSRALLVGLALLNLALVALHYFGALAVAAQLALLARAPKRVAATLVLAALPAALALAGWFAFVLQGAAPGAVARNAAWISPAGLREFPWFALHAVGMMGVDLAGLLLATLFGAALVTGLVIPRARVTAIATLGPIGLVLAAEAILGSGLWVPRYLIACIPTALITLALVLDTLPRRAWIAAATTLGAWGVLAGVHSRYDRAPKPDWGRIAAEFTRSAPATFCTNEEYVALPFRYVALRDALPLRVKDMRECEAGDGRSWAILRVGTESSTGALTARGARLGPSYSLATEYPDARARRITW